MPTIDDMFPRKFLRGTDLECPVTVTITSVEQEEIYTPGSGKENKWVLRVKGGTKGVVVSKTLAKQIAKITGSANSDDWIGCQIELHPCVIQVAGFPKTAVRARAHKPDPPQGLLAE